MGATENAVLAMVRPESQNRCVIQYNPIEQLIHSQTHSSIPTCSSIHHPSIPTPRKSSSELQLVFLCTGVQADAAHSEWYGLHNYSGMHPSLWYKSEQRLKLGDVCRYTVEYTTAELADETIFIRVKNTEKTGLRAVNMFIGPLVLYCHVVPCQYNHRRRFSPKDADGNREVCFRNTMQPGQTFNVKLTLNENSLHSTNADGTKTYQWECQVVSQIVINLRLLVSFVLAVGDDLHRMRRATRSVLTSLSKGDFTPLPQEDQQLLQLETLYHPGLVVKFQNTDDLWPTEPVKKDEPIHLVIITHGIFSNLTADMLYLRDTISAASSDNVVVSGFRGNAGHTEKGIHRLGVNVSHFVADLIDELAVHYTVGSISFVAHSLGGPVQLYALKHLLLVKGTDYFDKRHIRLRNFVCLACPMLGVLSEMSLWILWFLDLGTLGKTGRDLTLLKKMPRRLRHLSQSKRDLFRPILETLPDEPMRTLLKLFDQRVVYANAVHDGIVPLRTSALLYLDWEALGDVTAMKKEEKVLEPTDTHHTNHTDEKSPNGGNGGRVHPAISRENDVGEIPDDEPTDMKTNFERLFSALFNSGENTESGNGEPDPPKKSRRIKNRIKKYARISAKSSDVKSASELQSEVQSEEKDSCESASDLPDAKSIKSLNIPPKASAVESVVNTLLCPVPSENYITNPDERTSVIFHDKYYHFDSVPGSETDQVKGLKKLIHFTDWKIEKQVRIARKYHAPELSWRKVLVCLPPDAHNNIVVRRRFANGYGWGVIDHLADEVFAHKVKAKM